MKFRIFLLSSVLLFGCATAPTRIDPMKGSFAIWSRFVSSEGEAVAISMATRLMSHITKELIANECSVVNRAVLPTALQEMELSMKGVVDDKTLAELGKIKSFRYLIQADGQSGSTTITCTDIETMTVIWTEYQHASFASDIGYMVRRMVGKVREWEIKRPSTKA